MKLFKINQDQVELCFKSFPPILLKALDNRSLHQFALSELKVNIFVSYFTIFSSEILKY